MGLPHQEGEGVSGDAGGGVGSRPAKGHRGNAGESVPAVLGGPGVSEVGPTLAAVASDGDRQGFDPPRLVEVYADGQWWPGSLVEWARWPVEGWRAYVRWFQGTGSGYVKWVRPEAVRPR